MLRNGDTGKWQIWQPGVAPDVVWVNPSGELQEIIQNGSLEGATIQPTPFVRVQKVRPTYTALIGSAPGYAMVYTRKFSGELVGCVRPTYKLEAGACRAVCDGSGQYQSMEACLTANDSRPQRIRAEKWGYACYYYNSLTPKTYNGLPYEWSPPTTFAATFGGGIAGYDAPPTASSVLSGGQNIEGIPFMGFFPLSPDWNQGVAFDPLPFQQAVPDTTDVWTEFFPSGRLWIEPTVRPNNPARFNTSPGQWQGFNNGCNFDFFYGSNFGYLPVSNTWWRAYALQGIFDRINNVLYGTDVFNNQGINFGGVLVATARLYPYTSLSDPPPPPPPPIPGINMGAWELLYDVKFPESPFANGVPSEDPLPAEGYDIRLQTKSGDRSLLKVNIREPFKVHATAIDSLRSEIIIKQGRRPEVGAPGEGFPAVRVHVFSTRGSGLTSRIFEHPDEIDPEVINPKNFKKFWVYRYRWDEGDIGAVASFLLPTDFNYLKFPASLEGPIAGTYPFITPLNGFDEEVGGRELGDILLERDEKMTFQKRRAEVDQNGSIVSIPPGSNVKILLRKIEGTRNEIQYLQISAFIP